MSTERAGTVPGFPLVDKCFSGKYTRMQVRKRLAGRGGAIAYFNTNDFREIIAMSDGGIDVGDEPSALDFPYYGRVMDYVNRAFPNQFPYLNLYPNYASVSQNNAQETVNQLGTATYDEHIQKYCENVPVDYICYDFYLYSINVTKHYENLRVVADACRNTGRSMWIVLQVNSNKPAEWMSENNLRFQA